MLWNQYKVAAMRCSEFLRKQITKIQNIANWNSNFDYFIKDHDTPFVSDPNASASTLARRKRRREKYIRANEKLTDVLRQLINNK
jgi:hypothetical protein